MSFLTGEALGEYLRNPGHSGWPPDLRRDLNWISKENGCHCVTEKNNKHNQREYQCLMCQSACCKKAKQVQCVCLVSFECPDHGHKCYGSHS